MIRGLQLTRTSIVPLQTPKTEVLQYLSAVPTGGAPGKIIVVHGFNFEAELLGQIQNTIGRDRRMILHKEAVRGEEFKLSRQSQPGPAPACRSQNQMSAKLRLQRPIRSPLEKPRLITPLLYQSGNVIPRKVTVNCNGMFPQRSATWPKSQLRAGWAYLGRTCWITLEVARHVIKHLGTSSPNRLMSPAAVDGFAMAGPLVATVQAGPLDFPLRVGRL